MLGFESSVLGFESSVLGPEDGSVLGTRRTLCSLPSSPPPSPRRGLLGLLLSRLPRGPLRRHGRGDAAATVVRRTRAFGRGVPERVRGHGRSRGQARPRRRSRERGLTGHHREVATSFSFHWGLCKCLWEAPVSGEVEPFKCCRVSVYSGSILFFVRIVCYLCVIKPACEIVPASLRLPFFLLTLHPASRKRFVAGF